MTNKRTRRIDHYMHTASKQVVDLLLREGIGLLVIGKNNGWKKGGDGQAEQSELCANPTCKIHILPQVQGGISGDRGEGDRGVLYEQGRHC